MDNDGKLFCVKLKAYKDRQMQEFWVLPGGQIDFGESLQDALRREMIEETTIKPEIGNLLFVQQFKFADVEQLEFIFHVKNFADYKNFDITKASHAEEEIADFGFIDPKAEFIMPKFLATLDLPEFVASQKPTKFYSDLSEDIAGKKKS